MDTIAKARQMMAEQKFNEAIKQIDSLLKVETTARHELLLMLYEVSHLLERKISTNYFLELVMTEVQKKNYNFAEKLLREEALEILPEPLVDEIKISILEERGKLAELYLHIKDILLRRLENKNPVIPAWISLRVAKYFKNDFSLKLIELTSILQTADLNQAEKLLRTLIFQILETSRDVRNNLILCQEVLKDSEVKSQFDIFQGYFQLYLNGIKEKKDYKKIIEMVVYFDEFKLQVILLDLLIKLDLREEAILYTETIKLNEDYSFVYLDKHFKHLKELFHRASVQKSLKKENSKIIDEEYLPLVSRQGVDSIFEVPIFKDSAEEEPLINLLKYQEFNFLQFCDLAVSFLQLEMPTAALVASEKAAKLATTDKDFLKASYLKMTSLLVKADYRSVIDVALCALKRAETKEDILSFHYGEAEALMRLNKNVEAKKVLIKIISIDETYRLAKMRLIKLNEL